MAVDLTWSSPTAAQTDGGLALVTGDTLTQTSWQKTASNIYLLSQLAQGPGQLQYVSATQIRFRAVNGSVIRISGALYNLTADITAANTNIYIDGASGSSLGSSMLYYVYLFNNSGTLTIDFSTTAYAIDSTSGNYGTYIKTGIASRTLIGMIRTNGSSQFVDSLTQRFVVSWFNRRLRPLRNTFTATRTSTSATAAEVNSEIRIEGLVWDGEPMFASGMSVMSEGAGGNNLYAGIGFNGATVDGQMSRHNSGAAGRLNTVPLPARMKTGLTEGYNYATLITHSDGGGETMSFYYNSGPQSVAGCILEGGVWG